MSDNATWLYQIQIQVEAIERYVAALPGAKDVDFTEIKRALLKENNGVHGKISAETVATIVDVASKRIYNIANGETVPEFPSATW